MDNAVDMDVDSTGGPDAELSAAANGAAMTPRAIIYALEDPRTQGVRYVGATTTLLQVRLLEHVRGSLGRAGATNRAKTEWVRSLLAAGLMPRIRELERVRVEDKDAAERRWIAVLVAQGAELLNVHGRGLRRRSRIVRARPQVAQTRQSHEDGALSTYQAAQMLGLSERTVRRYIKAGRLSGQCGPGGPGQVAYRTTTQAVEEFKATRRTEERAAASDGCPAAPEPVHGALSGIMSELSETRRQLVDLARENGRLGAEVSRLEAELEQLRGQAAGDGPKRENGRRAGVWGRMGLWLRG